jgi:hypothetical protein
LSKGLVTGFWVLISLLIPPKVLIHFILSVSGAIRIYGALGT